MILACHNLKKAFGERVIVREGSFHIEEREKAALVGINGAGKSTILKMIMNEEPSDGGEIILAKGKTIGYLAQHQNMLPDGTIYDELRSAKADIFEMDGIRLLREYRKVSTYCLIQYGHYGERMRIFKDIPDPAPVIGCICLCRPNPQIRSRAGRCIQEGKAVDHRREFCGKVREILLYTGQPDAFLRPFYRIVSRRIGRNPHVVPTLQKKGSDSGIVVEKIYELRLSFFQIHFIGEIAGSIGRDSIYDIVLVDIQDLHDNFTIMKILYVSLYTRLAAARSQRHGCSKESQNP